MSAANRNIVVCTRRKAHGAANRNIVVCTPRKAHGAANRNVVACPPRKAEFMQSAARIRDTEAKRILSGFSGRMRPRCCGSPFGLTATYLGAAKPGESLFWQPLAAGTHTARAVDDHGRSDARELRVIAVD